MQHVKFIVLKYVYLDPNVSRLNESHRVISTRITLYRSLKLQCCSKISYDLSNVVFGTNCRTVVPTRFPSIIQGISFCIIFDIFIMVSFELFSCKLTLNHSHYAVRVPIKSKVHDFHLL